LGSGSTDFDIVSAAYTGSTVASGISTAFPAQHYLKGYFASGAVALTSGGASLALVVDNNPPSSTSDNRYGGAGDAQLSVNDAQMSVNGYDASVLTLQIKAKNAGTLQFKYTFASEEYNGELCPTEQIWPYVLTLLKLSLLCALCATEYVGSNFNDSDVFKLFVDGVNVAIVPGSGIQVTINNVNLGKNAAFYTNAPVGTA
jgi:uncharacterized protein YdgA (DUF945 family)